MPRFTSPAYTRTVDWSPIVREFKTQAQVRDAVRRFVKGVAPGTKTLSLPTELLPAPVVVSLVLRLRARRITPLWWNGYATERFARAGD